MDADATLNTFFNANGRSGSADLGFCVWELESVVSKGMASLLQTHDLTHIEFSILRLFLGVEEWTTSQLAQALSLALSGISRSVTKFVGRGLIQRRRLHSDRRVVILTLTEEGMALTQDLNQRVQAYQATLSEGVTEAEMKALASVSSRVTANYLALGETRPRSASGPSEQVALDE